jgi:hypothetical protein
MLSTLRSRIFAAWGKSSETIVRDIGLTCLLSALTLISKVVIGLSVAYSSITQSFGWSSGTPRIIIA